MQAVTIFSALSFIMTAMMTLYAQPQGLQYTSVRVEVREGSGLPVPEGMLTIRDKDGDSVYSGRLNRSVAIRMARGRYSFLFETQFFKPLTRVVDLSSAESFVLLAPEMENTVLDNVHEPFFVSASLSSGKSCHPGGSLWARLSGVYLNYSAEQMVKSAGDMGVVYFPDLELGIYILSIVDGEQVRAIKIIDRSSRTSSAKIALGPCAGAR